MTNRHEQIKKTIETCMFAPIGIALTLRDMAPTFVNMFVARGRSEVDRRQEQVAERIKHVKGAGEVALAFGVPMVKERITGKPAPAPTLVTDPQPAPDDTAAFEPEIVLDPVAEADADEPEADTALVEPEPIVRPELSIPAYDTLSASQIVDRLDGLSASELGAVADYERTHRNRRTILGKVEQLRVG